MPEDNLLSKKWCNLVFENRNKDYGAYILRRDEGKMLTRALVIVIVAFAAFILLPLVLVKWQIDRLQKDAMNTIANLSKLEPPKVKKQPDLRAVDVTQRIIAKHIEDAIKFMPEISEKEDAESQLLLGVDKEGEANEAKTLLSVSDSTVSDSARADEPVVSSKYPSPVEVVEEMPQFPGGLSALMKWVDKNLTYPPVCVRNKVEGRVEVSFYVDKDGKVFDPEVTKKLHPLLDREAVLTVMKMPKWSPGKVNGKVSVVRVTIPIEFAL